MVTAYIETEVDVDLDDFDTDDLLDELERRGELPVEGNHNAQDILTRIYYLRRQGQAYDHLMDSLIYAALGRVA
jgi:hypothetical protein